MSDGRKEERKRNENRSRREGKVCMSCLPYQSCEKEKEKKKHLFSNEDSPSASQENFLRFS